MTNVLVIPQSRHKYSHIQPYFARCDRRTAMAAATRSAIRRASVSSPHAEKCCNDDCKVSKAQLLHFIEAKFQMADRDLADSVLSSLGHSSC